jgi:hypothetical protein
VDTSVLCEVRTEIILAGLINDLCVSRNCGKTKFDTKNEGWIIVGIIIPVGIISPAYFSIKEIEQNQLTWYGHVQRMAEGRLPKLTLKWMPKQKRARGRPKKN